MRGGIRLWSGLVLILLVLAGCARDAQSSVETDEPTEAVKPSADVADVSAAQRLPAADVTGDFYVYSLKSAPLDALFYGAGAVVRVEVVDVAGPFWNQADGQKWVDDPAGLDYTNPVLYREVTLKPLEFYRNDLGIDATGNFTITVLGGGTDGELAVSYDTALRGGTFTKGEEVVVLLSEEVFYLREGPVDAIRPLLGGFGVLHRQVEDDGLVVFAPEMFGTPPGAAVSLRPSLGFTETEVSEIVGSIRDEPRAEWEWLRNPPTAERIEEMLRKDKEVIRQREEDRTVTTIEPGDPGG